MNSSRKRRVMKRLSLMAAITLIVFSLYVSGLAQGIDPRPDGWGGLVLNSGLVLNISNPDDAIRLFGTPDKDKDKNALELTRPLSWLSDKYKQKEFRAITYK